MDESHEICSEAHDQDIWRVWDTDQVPQSQAFDLYRDGVCSAFMPLRPERPSDRNLPFRSRHVSRNLRDVALNIVTASPHPVFKGKSEIAASASECYYVNLQLSGRCRITQADETVQLRSGQIAIFDSASPFALDHGETETLQVVSLMVPKTRLANGPSAAPQILSDHPVYGSALRQAATAIAPTVRAGGSDALLQLRDVVLGLTDLALCDEMSNSHPGTRRNAHYYRLCDLVRRHCSEPTTSVEFISSMIGLSVGTVRNIFTEHNDAFGRRLLQERIDLAKLVLRNPSNAHLTIGEVAYCCGFSDAAHFGRTFKSSTGMAPGAWRNETTRKPTVSD